jgi:hypothetical protein
MWGGGDHAAMLNEHLGHLKTELALTPDQEPAWQAFTADIKGRVGRFEQAHKKSEVTEDLTAPERLERFAARMKEHQGELDEVIQSFKRFYGTLRPEQQKTLDDLVAHRGHGPWRG